MGCRICADNQTDNGVTVDSTQVAQSPDADMTAPTLDVTYDTRQQLLGMLSDPPNVPPQACQCHSLAERVLSEAQAHCWLPRYHSIPLVDTRIHVSLPVICVLSRARRV